MAEIMKTLTQEQINSRKTEVGNESLWAWRGNGYQGTLEIATGVGKTWIGIRAVAYFVKLLLKRGEIPKILITTSRVELKRNTWVKNFIASGNEDCLQYCDIQCINTAFKYKEKYFHLYITDEAHSAMTTRFVEIYDNNKFGARLALTAEAGKKAAILEHIGLPTIYRYSIDQAERDGIVAPYKAYNLSIHLTEKEQTKYDELQLAIEEYKQELVGDSSEEHAWTIANHIQQGKGYLDNMTVGQARKLAGDYKKAINGRKFIVYNTLAKFETITELCTRYHQERIIIFSKTTDFVDALTDALNFYSKRDGLGFKAVKYHSKMGAKDKRDNLEAFSKGEADIAVSAEALIEGIDIPEAGFAICAAADRNGLKDTQLRGRVLRAKPGKFAIIVNLYCKGTMEKYWVADKSKDKKIQWINSVEQITHH